MHQNFKSRPAFMFDGLPVKALNALTSELSDAKNLDLFVSEPYNIAY